MTLAACVALTLAPHARADEAEDDWPTIEQGLVRLDKQDPADFLAYLKKQPAKKLARVVSAIQAKKITNPRVVLATSITVLAASSWASSNAPVVTLVQDMFASKSVKIDDAGGGWGVTTPKSSRRGAKTSSKITISSDIASRPEAIAAVLAHEGTHARQFRDGYRGTMFEQELEGYKAGAAYWRAAGKPSTIASFDRDMKQLLDAAAVGDVELSQVVLVLNLGPLQKSVIDDFLQKDATTIRRVLSCAETGNAKNVVLPVAKAFAFDKSFDVREVQGDTDVLRLGLIVKECTKDARNFILDSLMSAKSELNHPNIKALKTP